MIQFKHKKEKNIATWILCAIFFLLVFSCDESIANISNKKSKKFATQVLYNAYILRRDSGQVNLKFKAPIIEKYELVDSPYIEAKKGVYLEYFDSKNKKNPGKISSNYALYNELKDFYTAKGNVKIITSEGQTFVMQSIFWDRKNSNMYTKDTVFVTDKDGSVLVGANGMIAKDDFSEYTFFNNSGSFPTKEIPATGK